MDYLCNTFKLSDNEIYKVLLSAETKAKETMDKLRGFIQRHGQWDTPPIPPQSYLLAR